MARESAQVRKRPAERRPSPREANWHPVLVEALYKLIYRNALDSRKLASELARLQRRYGDEVFTELIYLLSHLRFEPREAKEHWDQVSDHRTSMAERLGVPVDLRVALVSYFVEVNRQLKNPKIIELQVFEQTQASAYRDELTGLCNYRYFREYLDREVERGERYNPPLSLVMIDIDSFKSYNDQNGHEAGNEVLTRMAELLSKSLRRIDVAARYGGEEFALILPSTSKTGAHQVAERAREKIEKYEFPHQASQPSGRLTVSMGVATFPGDAREASELVRRADSALYVAKAHGKNQVHLYGENRRSYGRIDARLEGQFCTVAPNRERLTMLNVSEGGMLFLTDRNLPIGTLLDLNFTLPGASRAIAASGRVVRVEETGDGQFEAGIRIIDIATADQKVLARFVRESGASAEPAGDAAGGD